MDCVYRIFFMFFEHLQSLLDLKRLLNNLGNLTNLEFERFQSSILHNVKVEIYNFKAKFIFVELIFRLSNRQTNFYQVFTLEMNSLILYFKLRISARFKVVKSLLFYMFKFLFYMFKFLLLQENTIYCESEDTDSSILQTNERRGRKRFIRGGDGSPPGQSDRYG